MGSTALSCPGGSLDIGIGRQSSATICSSLLGVLIMPSEETTTVPREMRSHSPSLCGMSSHLITQEKPLTPLCSLCSNSSPHQTLKQPHHQYYQNGSGSQRPPRMEPVWHLQVMESWPSLRPELCHAWELAVEARGLRLEEVQDLQPVFPSVQEVQDVLE